MKTNTVLLLLAAGLVGVYLLKKAQAIANLNFVPRGVSFSNGGLVLQLGVQNVTNTPLQVNSFVGSVMVNGGNFGNVTAWGTQTIAPNAETIIPVTITPNIVGTFQSLLTTFNNWQSGSSVSLSVQLQGNANISGQIFPINASFV